MPTGYTAELMEKGVTFERFIMKCARAFGVCITMRDEPFDAPIEEFAPSDYHKKAQAEAQKKHEELLGMNEGEKKAYGEKLKAEKIDRLKLSLQIDTEENTRLQDMLEKVKSWVPPTNEHGELKEFMIQQITISRHDLSYQEKELLKEANKEPLEYYGIELGESLRSIEYHSKEYAEEVSRVNGRNQWVKQLRDSIKTNVKCD